jgi:hypothetical protein
MRPAPLPPEKKQVNRAGCLGEPGAAQLFILGGGPHPSRRTDRALPFVGQPLEKDQRSATVDLQAGSPAFRLFVQFVYSFISFISFHLFVHFVHPSWDSFSPGCLTNA